MKFLIRSTFIGSPSDDKDLTFRNFLLFDDSGLGFDVPEDVTLWDFVRDFSRTHNHSPDVRTIRSHFEALRKPEPVDRLEIIQTLKPLYKGDFIKRLEERAEDRRVRIVIDLLREAGQIVQTGIEFKEGKNSKLLRGPVDAVRYLINKSHDVVTPTSSARLSGEVIGDGVDFRIEYDRVENDPTAGIGQFTGIRQLDQALRGAKKYELWTHAAFTGGLKSTFMLNWAYNQAIYMRYDSCVFSLEMPYNQCRRIIYAMHGMHGKFKEIRIQLGVQKANGPTIGLNYDRIRDGEMTPAEKTFLLNHVIPDFESGIYGKIHIEVADPDKDDFTVADLKSKAELIHSKSPFSLLFVDHAGLMAPRKWSSSTTERLNEVIRDLKRLAMNFNRGAGMAVVDYFQISREGFKAAEKIAEKSNGTFGTGPYNLTHLSYANECSVEGTILQSNRGLTPIEKISVGDKVWSSTGWKPVLALFNQGIRPTWDVVTDRGSRLTVTDNHQVRALKGESICWGHVRDLRPGDYVLGAPARPMWPDAAPSLPVDMSGTIAVPAVLTDDMAYLLGAWDGDGKVRPNGLGFTGNRKETHVLEVISETWPRVFPAAELKTYNFKSRPGSFDLECYNTALKKWFEDVSRSRGKVVPEVILQAPRKMLLSYLRGLFDTDGWINSQGVIGVKMKCEGFLRTIQEILTALGYDSHLGPTHTTLKSTGKTYTSWSLRLRGRGSVNLFLLEIGFSEPWKQQRVLDSLSATEKNKVMYPVPDTFLRAYKEVHPPRSPQTGADRSFYNAPATARRTGLVSHGDILTLLNLAGSATSPDLEYLRFVSTLHVMRVTSAQPTGREEPVYDIEVDGDHEYQTGPILSHNCERSSDVVTASFVNDDLRAQNRVLFQCLKTRDRAPFQNFYSRVEWDCRRILTSDEVPLMTGKPNASPDRVQDTLNEIIGEI